MKRPSYDEQVKKVRTAIVANGGKGSDVIAVPSERKIYVSDAFKGALTQVPDVNLTEIVRDCFYKNLRLINAGKAMTAYRVW